MPTMKGSADDVLAAFAANGMYPADDVMFRSSAPVLPCPPELMPKKSKYRNTKVEIDGRTFDSKKEANRYLDLREEQRSGTITGLRCQVAFPLTVNGTIVASYVADFVYTRDGREVIEDVKSVVTRKLPVYRLKAKIMAALGHTIAEV